MTTLAQLEAYTSELTAAVNSFASHCSDFESPPEGTGRKTSQSSKAYRARRAILAHVNKIQMLLSGPADFLQTLAAQNQLLSCLQWLGEFQVLACIPLHGSVPISDVAELAGVPDIQLCRIIRMTATAGFLQESQPGQVAHTALSARFVTKPSYLDAAMFLAETAAPAALQMAAATQRFGSSQQPYESAYNLAFNTSDTFASSCEQRPHLQRQWPAYLRYGMGDVDEGIMDILTSMDQLRQDNVTVVEVGAKTTERAVVLTNMYSSLNFIVQINGARARATSRGGPLTPNSSMRQQPQHPRLTIQHRVLGTAQQVSNAAVYFLNLPCPVPGVPSNTVATRIISELRAHVDVLRSRSSATLVLFPHLLPKPGSFSQEVDTVAYLRDLSLHQLANEREMEMLELMNMLNSVSDSNGRLVVVNKLRSRNNLAIVLEVRYKTYSEHQHG